MMYLSPYDIKPPINKKFIEKKCLCTKNMPEKNSCIYTKSSYEFHFGGLSNFSSSIEGLVQTQDVNSRISEIKYKTHIELVHELYGTCFQYNVKN